MLEPERVKFGGEVLTRGCIDLVDRERDRFAEPAQNRSQLTVDAGDFRASIDHEDDMMRVFEGDSRLFQDLRRDQLIIVGNNTAGIDHFEATAPVCGLAIDPVARNARLIAHNGAALSGDRVKEGRFSDVRSADDDDGRQRAVLRHRDTMIACTA